MQLSSTMPHSNHSIDSNSMYNSDDKLFSSSPATTSSTTSPSIHDALDDLSNYVQTACMTQLTTTTTTDRYDVVRNQTPLPPPLHPSMPQLLQSTADVRDDEWLTDTLQLPDAGLVVRTRFKSLPVYMQIDSDCNCDELMSWRSKDPSHWTSDDVLELVYHITGEMYSTPGDSDEVDLARFRGEKFRDISGLQLCRMTREDLLRYDPEYGLIIYNGLQAIKADLQIHESMDDSCGCERGHVTDDDDRFWRELLDIDVNEFSLNGHRYDFDDKASFENIPTPPNEVNLESFTNVDTVQIHELTPCSPASASIILDQLRNFTETELMACVASSQTDWTPYSPALQQRAAAAAATAAASDGCSSRTPRGRSTSPKFPIITDLWWLKRSRTRRTSLPENLCNLAADVGDETSCALSDDSLEAKFQGLANRGSHLWEFMLQLLLSPRSRGPNRVIQWEDREQGVFRILDSKKVAELWGQQKRNEKMTYEKLSRALRWCRTYGFLDALPKEGHYPKKLCFRFGPRAYNWRQQVNAHNHHQQQQRRPAALR